jgi:hypothetical protein
MTRLSPSLASQHSKQITPQPVIKMANFLSSRATDLVRDLDLPWRWAPRGTYSPNDNPSGLVSFATAENVSARGLVNSSIY